jgi:predicted flap endonuclease-1-like 5' DNA nuclease
MGNLSCCLWWLVFGILLGFLAFWLFDRWFRRSGPSALAAAEADLGQVRSENETLRGRLAAEQASSRAAQSQLGEFRSIAAAAAYGFAPKNRAGEDDLAIVEGIGPKIADLLRAQQIRTFAQLAATPVERLVQILADAGPRFKIANHPGTWPRQAELCAAGKWEELRNYQDVLIDGVDLRGSPESGDH